MNTSQLMDKQIMDLSKSQTRNNNDFIDLKNPQEDHIGSGGRKKEEILPSYDFQSILPKGGSSSPPSNTVSSNIGGTMASNSFEFKTKTSSNYGSLDSCEPTRVILEKEHKVSEAALVSVIDRTMKKHADNLLHAMEGVSTRLSLLESKTHHLENAVDDLKVSIGNSHGSTDGTMRQLEIILREVQTGVEVIKDKQEIMEAQLQLAKVQVSKVEQPADTQNIVLMDSVKLAASPSQQSHQHFPPVAFTQPPTTFSPPNAPPPPQQNLPPPSQLPNQFPKDQIPGVPQHESYFPLPGQTPEAQNQQYQISQPQQLQSSPPSPDQQQYQPSPPQQYSHTPPPPEQLPSLSVLNPQPQCQPPLGHPPEETPFMSSLNYPPSICQPTSHSTSGASPVQQLYRTPYHMYEPQSSRTSTGFSGAYGPSSGPVEPYPYGGSYSQCGRGSPVRPPKLSSPAVSHTGGSGYPQLPTVRILPHALPMASGVGDSSGASGAGNRVPIDDVVDKVTNMGFPRDQVRATVRKLTENRQSVDLNVVLDTLMNDGEGQPPRGWFGR